MLSYKHAFHAGNHADVLKHIVLMYSLDYMKRKSKPLMYLDTHAGSGLYSKTSDEALKNKEYENGISAVIDSKKLPKLVQRYVELVEQCQEENTNESYPGSPWLAKMLLQSTDCLFLYELHNNEFKALEANMAFVRSCRAFNSDGLKGMVASMPPVQRRGVVLIDPSYELKEDYERVAASIIKAYKRFTSATFLLWYPVVDRDRVDRLEKRLISSGIRNIMLYELAVSEDSSATGMTGSGMIVINQAWTLKKEMQEVLPFLSKTLGLDGRGCYRIETLVAEKVSD